MTVFETPSIEVTQTDYKELTKGKAIADAMIGMIRAKKALFADISRVEVELLYALYCEDGEE